MIHAYPVDEEARHELTGTACPCGHRVDWSEADAIVVHRSWNGRELIEEAEEIIRKEEAHESSNS